MVEGESWRGVCWSTHDQPLMEGRDFGSKSGLEPLKKKADVQWFGI